MLSSTARVFGSSTTSMLGLSEFGTAIVRLTSPDFASASNCRRRCLTGRAAGPCNATDFERSLGHFSATDVGGNELFVALSRRNLNGCIPRVRSISKLTRNSTHVDVSQALRALADQGPYCLGLHSQVSSSLSHRWNSSNLNCPCGTDGAWLSHSEAPNLGAICPDTVLDIWQGSYQYCYPIVSIRRSEGEVSLTNGAARK